MKQCNKSASLHTSIAGKRVRGSTRAHQVLSYNRNNKSFFTAEDYKFTTKKKTGNENSISIKLTINIKNTIKSKQKLKAK